MSLAGVGFDSKRDFVISPLLLWLPLALGRGVSPQSRSSTKQPLLLCLPSCWGFSTLGCGVSPHSCPSTTWLQPSLNWHMAHQLYNLRTMKKSYKLPLCGIYLKRISTQLNIITFFLGVKVRYPNFIKGDLGMQLGLPLSTLHFAV